MIIQRTFMFRPLPMQTAEIAVDNLGTKLDLHPKEKQKARQ
jgi:hypothetical protein